jgi:hypothetical protein
VSEHYGPFSNHPLHLIAPRQDGWVPTPVTKTVHASPREWGPAVGPKQSDALWLTGGDPDRLLLPLPISAAGNDDGDLLRRPRVRRDEGRRGAWGLRVLQVNRPAPQDLCKRERSPHHGAPFPALSVSPAPLSVSPLVCAGLGTRGWFRARPSGASAGRAVASRL